MVEVLILVAIVIGIRSLYLVDELIDMHQDVMRITDQKSGRDYTLSMKRRMQEFKRNIGSIPRRTT